MKYLRGTIAGTHALRVLAAVAVSACFATTFCPSASAQTEHQRAIIQQIDFDQKLDEQIPLDATFTDETGQQVQLGRYFGSRPVVVTLVYYECPMLCTEVLNGLLAKHEGDALHGGKRLRRRHDQH